MPNKIWKKITSSKNTPDFNKEAEELKELAERNGYRYYRNGKAHEYNLKDGNDKTVLTKVSLTEIYTYLKNI